jgi:hypothetical protein
MQRILKRMSQVAERYGIPADHKDRWFWLAYCLASEQAPEFRRSAGAPPTWNLQYELLLLREVRARVRDGQSASAACGHLIKRAPWKDLVGSRSTRKKRDKPGETLRERYARLESWLKKNRGDTIDIWVPDGKDSIGVQDAVIVPSSLVHKWSEN